MPAAKSSELFMFHTIVIMSTAVVGLFNLEFYSTILCSLPQRNVGHTCQRVSTVLHLL